jgi:Flp pilus assembly protein TadD
MKANTARNLSLVVAASLGVMACNPLNKMAKNSNDVNYSVTPDPLEMHGDSVEVTVKGSYPAKYFNKKAVVDVKPVFVSDGQEVKEFETITLVGQDAEEDGRKVNYDKGGSFTYVTKVPYKPEMMSGELKAKIVGRYKSKSQELANVKVADGTIVTPNLVEADDKPILGSDEFQRITTDVHNAQIHYLINSSYVRPSELRDEDMEKLIEMIEKKAADSNYVFKKADIQAYASPDGELSLNEDLAKDRAESAAKALKRQMRKADAEKGTKDEFYNLVGKGEDWKGFKKAMQASDIKDKDLILRVLEMYQDVQKREQEIKNLAETYTVLKDEILPELRRSQIALSIDKVGKSDEQIAQLAADSAKGLNVEELLYAATLTDDLNKKLEIYKKAAKIYADDWRGHNNAGYVKLMQNDVSAAKSYFEAAQSKASNNPIVMNNLGVIARLNGDRSTAMDYYNKANGAGDEVNYNKGIVNILNGNYDAATSNFSSFNSVNKALAQILAGSADQAVRTIDDSDEKTTAKAYYLKAIAGARTNNKELVMNNLKTAISKDPAMKDRAMKDAEFIDYDLSTL